jgi:isoleucyl-tRNA synthetase
VLDPETNAKILRHMDSKGSLFRSFRYQNAFYRERETQERVVMLTKDSWFLRLSDKLLMKGL